MVCYFQAADLLSSDKLTGWINMLHEYKPRRQLFFNCKRKTKNDQNYKGLYSEITKIYSTKSTRKPVQCSVEVNVIKDVEISKHYTKICKQLETQLLLAICHNEYWYHLKKNIPMPKNPISYNFNIRKLCNLYRSSLNMHIKHLKITSCLSQNTCDGCWSYKWLNQDTRDLQMLFPPTSLPWMQREKGAFFHGHIIFTWSYSFTVGIYVGQSIQKCTWN